LNDPVIRLDGVHLELASRAGIVKILRGISLSLPQGQSIAIIGPSGSGKTSLLMVTAGLERANAGSVMIRGQELTNLGEDALAVVRGRDLGIVFQSFHLVPTMTALENVALPMELAGEANAFERAQELLTDVGLAERAQHFPSELSGGEQQRVAIARALSRNPPIILADEPTGNLDTRTGKQIIDLLFGLRAKMDATLVMVTHDEVLAAKADRIIRMSDGVIVGDEAAKASVRRVGA
jgi:putative ABC transport system ATP-binding protein